MSMDGAPVIPTSLQIYNSYEEDPKYQIKFTIVWVSFAVGAILVSLPRLIRSIRNGGLLSEFTGISESRIHLPETLAEKPEGGAEVQPRSQSRRLRGILSVLVSFLLWEAPGLELNVGQLVITIGYMLTVLFCIVTGSDLINNSNRAGFLAVAQLPPVFLLATKNNPLSMLLGAGLGYEKLNFIHRWIGRSMFLSALVHGSLWIRNHLQYGLAIIGQQKETSGIAAFGLLGVIVLSSLKPVRKWAYEVFFVVHILAVVAFFITLCYHTIYASPWIFAPLAFYGFDLALRFVKYRFQDVTLVAVDSQMTLITLPYADQGWTAGSHVRLRVFFDGRILESHPLTIINAPAGSSCVTDSGMLLGAKVCGDWSKALNVYAMEESARSRNAMTADAIIQVPSIVLVDGPYGGCSIDLGQSENVLLFSGGSGATFALAMLDDILGRCLRQKRKGGEVTKRIEFAWCIRSFASIEWFAPLLMDLATRADGSSIDLHMTIWVTCLCNPDAVPPIPNSDVVLERPSVSILLDQKLLEAAGGGGVAVCASGPASLTRETQNVVAKASLTRGYDVGGIDLHTETYTL